MGHRIHIWLAVLALLLPPRLDGQQLRGTVREGLSQQAVAGVVVSVMAADSSVVARTLTDEAGEFRLAGYPAGVSLRAQRIGFYPVTVAIPSADTGEAIVISLVALPWLLERTLVVANSCGPRADAELTAALLEQARMGVLAVVVARERDPGSFVRVRFDRLLQGRQSVTESVRLDSTVAVGTSFLTGTGAANLARDGFWGSDTNGAPILHAPDADILLDDDFVRAYCFHIVRPRERQRTELGLGFRREGRSEGRVDIDGTLWVDTASRAIREIEFRYRGLNREVERLEPGGRIVFSEMPNGVTLIERWSLRLVGATVDTVIRAPGAQFAAVPTEVQRLHVRESGGELAAARWSGGLSWRGSLGTVRLHVTDSSGTAVDGTALRLARTDYRAVTDASGAASMPFVLPGAYPLMVEDTLLAPIGLEVPTSLVVQAVRDSTVEARVIAPRTFDYVGTRCARHVRFVEGDTIPYIVGQFPSPPADTRIRVGVQVGSDSWQRVRAFYDVGTDGYFFICSDQLRVGMHVRIEAHLADTMLAHVEQVLGSQLTVLRVPSAR